MSDVQENECKTCEHVVYYFNGKWHHKSTPEGETGSKIEDKNPCGFQSCDCTNPEGISEEKLREKIKNLRSDLAKRKKPFEMILFVFLISSIVFAAALLLFIQSIEYILLFALVGGICATVIYNTSDSDKQKLDRYTRYLSSIENDRLFQKGIEDVTKLMNTNVTDD